MPRFTNTRTGVVVDVSEDDAKELGPEYVAEGKPQTRRKNASKSK